MYTCKTCNHLDTKSFKDPYCTKLTNCTEEDEIVIESIMIMTKYFVVNKPKMFGCLYHTKIEGELKERLIKWVKTL